MQHERQRFASPTSGGSRICQKGEEDGPWRAHGARAYNGPEVWGRIPQRGPGADPLVGLRSKAPLKMKAFDHFHTKTAKSYELRCKLADVSKADRFAQPRPKAKGQ